MLFRDWNRHDDEVSKDDKETSPSSAAAVSKPSKPKSTNLDDLQPEASAIFKRNVNSNGFS